MSDLNGREEDFAGLGSSFLEEALRGVPLDDDDAPRAAPQPSQPQPVAPEAPRAPAGGMRPLIERKRREIIELEKKIETHRETGVYQAKDSNNQSYFDYLAMQEDQARLSRLTRELGELRERDGELRQQASQRVARAREMAKAMLAREIPRIPENLRKRTAEMFAAILSQTLENGALNRQEYADRGKLQEALDQMMSAAYGAAARAALAGPKRDGEGAPAPSGYDEADDPRKPARTEEEEDDFTNNLLFAYAQKKQRSLSVAEAKRAALEARQKKEGAGR